MHHSSKEFRDWLIHELRRISYKYPAYGRVKKAGKVDIATFSCMQCKMYCYTGTKSLEKTGLLNRFPPDMVKKEKIDMDHVEPVIDPNTGFVDWNTFIPRLFVEDALWARLCKSCHQIKTQNENKTRRLVKASVN